MNLKTFWSYNWVAASKSEWLGSEWPSTRTPTNRALRFTNLVSLSAGGTFLATVGSGFMTCSFKIANNWVWLSNKSLFKAATPPTVADGSSCLTQVSNSAATMGWPGWPCAYARAEMVLTPAIFSALCRCSATLTWSSLRSNWASESTMDAMAAECRGRNRRSTYQKSKFKLSKNWTSKNLWLI